MQALPQFNRIECKHTILATTVDLRWRDANEFSTENITFNLSLSWGIMVWFWGVYIGGRAENYRGKIGKNLSQLGLGKSNTTWIR